MPARRSRECSDTAVTAPPPGDLVDVLRAAGCVFAEDEARVLLGAARSSADLDAMVGRRAAGVPLEQVVGWASFCGLRIPVEPGVFVPRRRTEFLVERAVAVAPARRATVVDLCCGSGAVGAAVTTALQRLGRGPVELHAADLAPAAVRCAGRTLAALGGQVHAGDLFAALPAGLLGRVDVLVVNAPYVPTAAIATMPPEARLHEPPAALDGGPDGLAVHRRVADAAPGWLAPGGCLLLETSRRQAEGTAAAVGRVGLEVRVHRCDERDATVVVGTRSTPG